MTSLRTLSAAALLVTFASCGALAQGAGQGPVASACKAEIEKLCAGKQHGGGDVRACLEGKKAEVSAACKSALDSTGPGKGPGKAK